MFQQHIGMDILITLQMFSTLITSLTVRKALDSIKSKAFFITHEALYVNYINGSIEYDKD